MATPDWRTLPAAQQPPWPDPDHLEGVLADLRRAPAIVAGVEVAALRDRLAEAAAGRAVLLQVGDCAEPFDELTHEAVGRKLAVYDCLATELGGRLALPAVLVGRIAGQFGKPRSAPTERRGDLELPSFRGHAVNDAPFTPRHRTPDPERLRRGHWLALSAMGRVRAGGGSRPVFTSHEALLVGYEDALVRAGPAGPYGGSAHLLWVGERTRQLDGAHLAFLAGVANPLACKCGPSMTPDEVVAVCDALNPGNEPGRLTLVTRLGAGRVRSVLPGLIDAVTEAGREVLWACDPMHGNPALPVAGGRRARDFADMRAEVSAYVAVHAERGTWPGGLHLECAAEPVTECLGGPDGVAPDQVPERYRSLCDPRLDPRQACALIRHAAREMARCRAVRRPAPAGSVGS
jgi:3-deoxy-D-arabino-heptulosonate 7-phosphate (DAHP) synthase class II